jgi:hypothetical protein
MALAAKYQIFISSTFEDLKEERDQVIRAVLEMGHIPVGMEMFSAADDEQWKIIARHIEESDYYAVVVAHRLGSLTDGGISYTRKEYEHAAEKGIPILGFVLDEKASWPADRFESKDGPRKALDEFRDLIRAKPVSFWTSADDLYGRFTVALMKAFSANPREGWVRASTAGGGAEVTAEVIRLSSENASLRAELLKAKEDSQKEQHEAVASTVRILFQTKRKPTYRYTSRSPWQRDASVSLFSIFHLLGRSMLVEASVSDMARTLAMQIRVDKQQGWDRVANNQLRNLLADLMALDLVQPSIRKHQVSDRDEYWSLSPFGHEVMKSILKLTLKEKSEEDPVAESESTSDSGPDDDDEI